MFLIQDVDEDLGFSGSGDWKVGWKIRGSPPLSGDGGTGNWHTVPSEV